MDTNLNQSKDMPESITDDATSPENDAVRKLERLHRLHIDSIKGYETIIKDSEDERLRTLSREIKRMHERHHDTLHGLLSNYKDVDESGTVAGSVHRAWVDLKSKLAERDIAVILESMRFGERYLDERYEEALNGTAAAGTREGWHNIVAQQHEEVQAILATIEELYEQNS